MSDERSSRREGFPKEVRSPWLVPGLLALVILAVAGTSVLVAFTTAPTFPEAPPEKPADLTTENATEFVRKYEYARVYDDIADGANRVEIDCEADLLNRTDRGFYVSVECEGYASGPNFDSDYAAKPVAYFVNESATRRLGTTD